MESPSAGHEAAKAMGPGESARSDAEAAAFVGEAAVGVPSFTAVYDAYFTFVWTSARRLGVPDALLDDATQEVFVVVHRQLAQFGGCSSLKTWLFAIVRNVTRDVRRTIRRKSPHDAPGALADPDAVEAAAEQQPDRLIERSSDNKILHALLEQLDAEKREVFVLIEIEQFSAAEVAEAVGVNVNTVYSRLRLAREAFAEAAARYRTREKGSLR